MHVQTYNFTEIEANVGAIRRRIIHTLFDVRETDGASAFLMSVFLPDGQCHVVVAVDAETPYRCHLTVVTRTPEGSSVAERLPATEYEQAVRYLTHIALEFDDRRHVSNLVVTTDDRRIQNALATLRQSDDW